jgi:hypothetical protein
MVFFAHSQFRAGLSHVPVWVVPAMNRKHSRHKACAFDFGDDELEPFFN